MLWTPNICRICAQVSSVCVPIFHQKNSSEGVDAKIRHCFLANILPDDLKPKQICQRCHEKLDELCTFITVFHDSNYRFETILYHQTNDANLPTNEYSNLDLSAAIDTVKPDESLTTMCTNTNLPPFNEPSFVDEIVLQQAENVNLPNFVAPNSDDRMIVEMSSNNQNLQLELDEIGDPLECKNLKDVVFDQDKTFNRSHQLEPWSKVKKRSMISVQDIYEEVKKEHNIVNDIQKSPKFYRTKRSKCSNTNIVLNNFLNDAKTNNGFESNENVLKVTVSDDKQGQSKLRTYSTILNVEEHEAKLASESTTTKKPKVISVISLQITKERKDNNLRKHVCKECDKSFARHRNLKEHVKKHGEARPFTCDQCDKAFAIQWDLNVHKRTHTDKFGCPYCPKRFGAQSKLNRHVRTHTGEKPFVCTYDGCGRSFADKRNLMTHNITTHTNVRCFQCTICHRRYKTNSQLKDHTRAHDEMPAFRCDECGKLYKWKANLLNHMKKHQNYRCLLCPKICINKLELNRHMKSCQGGVSSNALFKSN